MDRNEIRTIVISQAVVSDCFPLEPLSLCAKLAAGHARIILAH